MAQSESIKLKFEGQTHSIDANTLINVLTYYQIVIQEANKEYGGGSRDVTLNINAIEQGSFVIDVEVVQSIAQQLFSRDTIEYIAGLVGVVGGVYALYEKSFGKPVNDTADITNNGITINGDVSLAQTIINVYNKKSVRGAISKSIETADNDTNVEGFTIISNDCNTAHFDKDKFKEYIYDDFENEEATPNERVIDDVTTLVIVGLSFEKGANWQFIYRGFKITVRVKDDALMKAIDDGARFGKGDCIKVKLQIIQKYNKEYSVYENKRYKIAEFYEHITPQQPIEMFKDD